ncbi:hypothetical protein AKO1_006650, partial [Acrasis kona]
MSDNYQDLFPPYPGIQVDNINPVPVPVDHPNDPTNTSNDTTHLDKPKIQHAYVKSVDNSFVPDFPSLNPSDFETIKILGTGDVGKVYLVRLKGFSGYEQLYAMKVIDLEDVRRRNKSTRIETEKNILQSISHPFIVKLYCTYKSEKFFYFLMEYCPGGEFFRVLQHQPHRCISEAHAKFYAAEVLNAIEYLHAVGIVYRDLKPENIMIHKSGHIRLADFDLSKQLEEKNIDEHKPKYIFSFLDRFDKDEQKRLHAMKAFVGTAEYLSPEVITGVGYSPLVDWWALGILVYEMLFGRTPFKGGDNEGTFNHIIRGTFVIPKENAHGPISKQCQDLIKRLLTADVHSRLGHKNGGAEIREHAFFKDVDCLMIQYQIPPIKPHIESIFDTRHFSGDKG